MFKKLLKPRAFFAVSLTILLCSGFLNIAVSIVNFPDEIHILATQENKLSLSSPFLRGKIEPDVMAVVNINNQPVSGNIDVDLSNEISIKTDEETAMDMKVSLFGLPFKTVSIDVMSDVEVVPCGMTVGVRFETEGIMVLGTGAVTAADGEIRRPSEGILKSGDILLEANGKKLENKERFIEMVENLKNETPIELRIKRDNEIITSVVIPCMSKEENKYMLGVWLRDSTQGIGTITYYNPLIKTFGALGHGILDVDTKKLMTVRSGKLMQSNITSVRKGKKGSPGELIGEINEDKVVGTIKMNTGLGLYGHVNEAYSLPTDKMKISLQGQIHEGPAVIRSNISGNETKSYDVYIESVNKYSSDESKGMVIRITDQELITKTNGIVQGMSGSPIIQDGKLAGAVTHVFVQNPLKGYGIFIENMMKQEKNI